MEPNFVFVQADGYDKLDLIIRSDKNQPEKYCYLGIPFKWITQQDISHSSLP